MFYHFPAVSSSFQQFPAVSSSFQQFPAVSSSFQQFPAVSHFFPICSHRHQHRHEHPTQSAALFLLCPRLALDASCTSGRPLDSIGCITRWSGSLTYVFDPSEDFIWYRFPKSHLAVHNIVKLRNWANLGRIKTVNGGCNVASETWLLNMANYCTCCWVPL